MQSNQKQKHAMSEHPEATRKYRVTYREGDELMEWTCRAHDAGHAEERFIDSVMNEDGCFMGIRILSVKRIRERMAA